MDLEFIPKWLCIALFAIGTAVGIVVGMSHGIANGVLATLAVWILCGGAEIFHLWIKNR
jgi:hypothetical protein